jgi:UDP-N-acetylmuramoyl-L-alanyl-D-glutamate--2,6-diaminopimelate ligase
MASVRSLFADLPVTIEGDDVEVRALTYDSRKVVAGACFASLSGARADGHVFIPQALERGATSVLCKDKVATPGATRILADDTRAALATAARRFYGDPAQALCMLGVTGTNGKTTTTHLLESLLAAAGKPCGVIGTLGWRFGERGAATGLTTPESADLVALLADMKKSGAQAVAMEVSSHALVQHRVGGVDFDVGLFTNLTHDHLDYHGTMDAYFEAKALLFSRRLKRAGKAVLNLDDPYVARLVDERTVGFSARGDQRAQVRLVSVDLGAAETLLTIDTPRGQLRLRSPLVGRFNVENVLGAVAAGEALGLSHDVISRGIAAVRAVPGRLERVSAAGEPLVLVDYAHTPDALDKALRTTRELVRGRLFCVFGCGGDRDPKKRPSMGKIAGALADVAVLTSDNPRSEDPELIASAVEGGLREAGLERASGPDKRGYVVELDRARAIRLAVSVAKPEDAVLVAGKGHETYQIIGTETRHFDDREEARSALADRKKQSSPSKRRRRP